jgi:phosphatidylinositol-3-phosphatase
MSGKVFQALLGFAMLLRSASTLQAVPPAYDHVVIVIEENEQYQAIIGSTQAPYINSLANNGVSLASMHAIVHPSQPNYLELYSGSNQGVISDSSVGAKFTTPNLGASLIAAGRTFAGYSESLPAEGDITSDNVNGYVKRHCPWICWMPATDPLGLNQIPRNLHKPFTAFPSDFTQLPTVSFVIPNNDNNMHTGSISTADAWIKTNLSAYAEWAKTNNSLLIITWDEDSFQQANRIPTIFYGANLQPWQNNGAWSLHNLLRTLEDMYGLPHAGRAAQVPPITGSFSSELPVITKVFSPDTTGPGSVTDTMVTAQSPTTTFGTSTTLKAQGGGVPAQSLVKFPVLFGSTSTTIPTSATIVSAKLLATTVDNMTSTSSGTIGAYRMLIPWSDSSTYSSLTAGVQLNDVEASSVSDFTVVPSFKATAAVFDVTPSLLAFQGGATNQGWVLNNASTDDWFFHSAENLTFRPTLEVSYVADLVGFDLPRFVVTPGGVEALVTLHRYGPAADSVSVSYATADNTALAGSDYTSVSGSFSWPAGDSSPRTIVIPINADTIVEGAEKFKVLLSALTGQVAFDRFSSAEIVIDEKSYDLWRWKWFGLAANNADTSPDADPDMDNVSNRQEYWFGSNPQQVDGTGGFRPTVVLSNNRLGFSFRRNKSATGLTYTVQVSQDLVSWADGSSYSPTTSTPNTAVTEEDSRIDFPEFESIGVLSVSTIDIGALYMRLKITEDP